MKHMPIIGKFWYYYMGDGIERLQERRNAKDEEAFNEGFDIDLGDI